MGGCKTKPLLLAIGLLAFLGTPGLASPFLDNSHLGSPLRYPGAPKPPNDDQKPPYAMNYADEAAQTLGVKDGHLDVFSTHPGENQPFVPVVSGGLGGDGAMLRLQWRPDQ